MNYFFYLLAFVLTAPLAVSQGEWELRKDEDGIVAYTRELENLKFDEYRVETTIKASLSEVLSIFKDFEIYPDLFPGMEDVKVYLDEPSHHITYVKFNLPFPARNRDAVFDNYISYDKSRDMLKVKIFCLPDQYETNPKLIRIKSCEGMWEFKKVDDGYLDVRHQMFVDPSGKAPAFLVNAKLVKDPIKTLKALRAKIQDDKYKGHTFALLYPE